MNLQYKREHSIEQRRFESERIRRRYPDRIPVIVQPLLSSTASSSSSSAAAAISTSSLFRSFSTSSSSSSCHEMTLARLDNEKFLVPSELSFSQFAYNIRRRLRLRAEHALFFYIGLYGQQPIFSSTMEHLYNENKDTDGFLYVCYADEKVFG
jgi:GABA(A) receptor-associated protein